MPLMMGSLYDALRAAGAEDDKARKASEEIAGYENRLSRMDGDLMLLKWMVGFDLAITVAIAARLFWGHV